MQRIVGDLKDDKHCALDGTDLIEICQLNDDGGPHTIVLCPRCGIPYRLPEGRQLARLDAFHLHGYLSQLGYTEWAKRALRFCKGPFGTGYAWAFED